MDILGNLPQEMVHNVLLYLGPEDIDSAWNCYESLRYLWNYDYIWKKVCRKNGYCEVEECLTSVIYKESMLKYSLHWRAVYKYNQIIESNWKHGKFKCIPVAEEKKYTRINYFDEEILVATNNSYTNVTVDIINCLTGKIDGTFNEEKIVIKTLKHQNLVIFFVSERLKVWNLTTKSWILNLEFQVSYLLDEDFPAEIRKDLLAFIYPPYGLYVVNLKTKQISYRNASAVDVCFGDNIIMFLSKIGNKIHVLNLNYKLLMSFNCGGNSKIEYIMTKSGYVIIYYIKITNQEFQNVCVYRVKENTRELCMVSSINVSYRTMRFPNDGTILFWKREKRKSLYKIWNFTADNRAVGFYSSEKGLRTSVSNSRHVFIVTDDFTVNMMCLQTGKFIRDIKNDILICNPVSLEVTEKKLAYIKSDKSLCIQNYDFIGK